MKTALITGILGQDGAYLARQLLDAGYRVVGGMRRASSLNDWRLRELGIADRVELMAFDLLEQSNVTNTIRTLTPDEIYNLAAQSFVGVSFEQPVLTGMVDGMAVTYLLEAVRMHAPDCRFYQASTSEMFGRVQAVPQTETTSFYPRSPYGVAKLYGHWITVNYREAYGIHASSGILFNHESPLRGREFVTRKITSGLAEVQAGEREKISLGNLEAERDWGFAGDYVDAMYRMVQADVPDDFVVATGETHKVRDFVDATVAALGIDIEWRGQGLEEVGVDRATGRVIVDINRTFYRPAEVDKLLGNPAKAADRLGWTPTLKFETLVEEMVRADVDRVKKGLIG